MDFSSTSDGLHGSISAMKQLTSQTWLSSLGLTEYVPLFVKYKTIEDLMQLNEGDLKELGIKNGAHRARMSSNLVLLREAHLRRMRPKIRGSSGSNSPNVTPPSFISHPDYAIPSPSSTHQLIASTDGRSSPGGTQRLPPRRTNDMSKNSWYHGSITREAAENLVQRDGEFLIRDSTTQTGDFVLTVCWKQTPLHFVVNIQVMMTATNDRRTQFHFEEEMFGTVTELVQYYAYNRKPITVQSGAIITTPVLRLASTQVYPTTPVAARSSYAPGSSMFDEVLRSNSTGSQQNLTVSANSSNTDLCRPVGRRGSMPSGFGRSQLSTVEIFPDKALNSTLSEMAGPQTIQGHHRSDSEPMLSPKKSESFEAYTYDSALNCDVTNHSHMKINEASTHSTDSPCCVAGNSSLTNPVVLKTPEGKRKKVAPTPPVKPSRVPTVKLKLVDRPVVVARSKGLYKENSQDYANSDQIDGDGNVQDTNYGNSEVRSTGNLVNDIGSCFPDGTGVSGSGGPDYTEPDQHLEEDYDISRRGGDNLVSLGAKNSLESTSLSGVSSSAIITRKSEQSLVRPPSEPNKSIIFYVPDVSDMASYFDDIDSHVSEFLTAENKPLDPTAVASVKEILLSTSPQLIARHITSHDVEVTRVMGKTDLGLGVTSGLELITLPHGAQLRRDITERYHCIRLFVSAMLLRCASFEERAAMLNVWIIVADQLRTSYGNLFAFSAVIQAISSERILRLKSTWLQLQRDHVNSSSLFLTKLLVMFKNLNNATGTLPLQNITVPHIMPLIELMETTDNCSSEPWRIIGEDFSLDALLAHLDTARIITEHWGLYKTTAETRLSLGGPLDARLTDALCVQMHLKLLFGARSVRAERHERYAKFERVLDMLSEKVENN